MLDNYPNDTIPKKPITNLSVQSPTVGRNTRYGAKINRPPQSTTKTVVQYKNVNY